MHIKLRVNYISRLQQSKNRALWYLTWSPVRHRIQSFVFIQQVELKTLVEQAELCGTGVKSLSRVKLYIQAWPCVNPRSAASSGCPSASVSPRGSSGTSSWRRKCNHLVQRMPNISKISKLKGPTKQSDIFNTEGEKKGMPPWIDGTSEPMHVMSAGA